MLGVIYSCSNVPLAIWPCSFNQESLIPNLCRSFRVSVWRTTPNREVICSSVLSMPSLLYQRDGSGHVFFFWLSLIRTRFWGCPSQWACSWKKGVELKNWSKVWKKLTKKGPEISGQTHLHLAVQRCMYAVCIYNKIMVLSSYIE